MTRQPFRRPLDVYEVLDDEGNKGIEIDGFVYAGVDGNIAKEILLQVLENDDWAVETAIEALLETGGFVTTEQVCEVYHVTPRTVYRWQDAGRLHGTKAGRRWLFARSEVEALAGKGEGMEA